MTEQDDGGRDEAFLQRWSRRKTEEAGKEDQPPVPELEEEHNIVTTDDEAEVADIVADLPDIETLDKDSDYTGFLREGVPEALKNMALRKLWLSDPVFANLDGLNDYDEDFGAIMKAGAEYMQKLKDAGEKLTRPGSEEPETPVAENEETDTDRPDGAEPTQSEPDVRKPESGDLVAEDSEAAESGVKKISASDIDDDAPPESDPGDRTVPDSENSSA